MSPATEPAEHRCTKHCLTRNPYPAAPYSRQAFHHPRTSLGAAGHLLHLGMVAAPLLIPEIFQDADKRFRALRLVPVIGAIGSEALWTLKLSNDRKKDEEAHAALESCRERCR